MQSVHVFDESTLYFSPLAGHVFQKVILCHLLETVAEVLGLAEIWLTWSWTSPPAHHHSNFPLGAALHRPLLQVLLLSYLCHLGLDLLKLVLHFLLFKISFIDVSY